MWTVPCYFVVRWPGQQIGTMPLTCVWCMKPFVVMSLWQNYQQTTGTNSPIRSLASSTFWIRWNVALLISQPSFLACPYGELLRSSEQNQRLNKILSLIGTEIDFLLLDLGYAVFEIPNLVNDVSKLNGARPFGNVGIDYGDEEVNEEVNALVRRSAALPSARDSFLQNYSPNGNIGATRLVSIHTSRDGLVKVENQQVLKNLVPAAQLTTAIVVEDEASHCGFTDDEGLAAWNSLISWVETDSQPGAQDILNSCQRANGDPDQCRYDPAYQIADTLPGFPWHTTIATLGSNTFDASTGIVSIESLRVDNSATSYNLQLLPQ